MTFVAPVPTLAQSLNGGNTGVTDYGVAADVLVKDTRRDQEYVTSGRYNTQITGDTVKVLSQNIDDVMRLLGPRTYAQMETDPEIAKCLTVIKTYVLSDGLDITPALAPHDVDYVFAKEVSDYVNRAVNNLATPPRDTFEQMLDALIYGHKVAEITYELRSDGIDKGQFHLKYLKVKPQKSVAFVVDDFMNVLGFKAAGAKNTDGKLEVIPREKFLVMTFRTKDDDPRGTSILRSVYNAWAMKMTMWPEYLKWLKNSAIPVVVGMTSETNDLKNAVFNADGTLARDAAGNPVYIPATSQLANALAQIRNGSVVALPGGSKVEAINSNTSGDPFKNARDVLNQEIEMAMLLQTLATSDSKHNTRAASETQMTVLDTVVYHLKNLVIEAFKRDVVKNLVRYRYGDDVADNFLPKISLGDSERRLWAKDVTAVAALYKAGVIKDSQLPGIYRQLGLEQVSEEEWTRELKLKAAELALAEQRVKLTEAQTTRMLTAPATPAPTVPGVTHG